VDRTGNVLFPQLHCIGIHRETILYGGRERAARTHTPTCTHTDTQTHTQAYTYPRTLARATFSVLKAGVE